MVSQKDLAMNIAEEIRWFQSPGIFREDGKTSFPLNKDMTPPMTSMTPTILTNPCFPDTNTSIARDNEGGSRGEGNKFPMETL